MLVTLNLIRYKKLCQVQSNVPCIIKLIIYMYVYTRDKKKNVPNGWRFAKRNRASWLQFKLCKKGILRFIYVARKEKKSYLMVMFVVKQLMKCALIYMYKLKYHRKHLHSSKSFSLSIYLLLHLVKCLWANRRSNYT